MKGLLAAGKIDRDQSELVRACERVLPPHPGRFVDVVAVQQQDAGLVCQFKLDSLQEVCSRVGAKPIKIDIELLVAERVEELMSHAPRIVPTIADENAKRVDAQTRLDHNTWKRMSNLSGRIPLRHSSLETGG